MSTTYIENAYHDVKSPYEISVGLKDGRFLNGWGYIEDPAKHTVNYVMTVSRIVESALLCAPLPRIGGLMNNVGQIEFCTNCAVPGALVAFMENKFPLVGMRVLKDYEGYFYSDLPGIYQNRIDDCKLDIHYVLRNANLVEKEHMFFKSLEGNFSDD